METVDMRPPVNTAMVEREKGWMDVHTPSVIEYQPNETIYLRGAVDAAGAIVYTIDRSFRIRTVNAAWNAFALANGAPELQAPAVIGTNLLAWVQGEEREETRRLCESLLRGETASIQRDFDCSSPDERRIFSMMITPVRHGREIVGASFVCHDITRRKILEDEIQARNNQLKGLIAELRRQHGAAERERDHARALGRVIAMMNQSLSTQATVDTLLAVATRLVRTPAAAVYLLAKDRARFEPWGSRGVDLEQSDPRAFELATSTATAVLGEQLFQAAGAGSNPRQIVYPCLTGGRLPQSLHTVPISTVEGVIGVLEVYSPVERVFDEGDRELLATLAASAGVAITNARMFDDQVRARQEAERLAQEAAAQTAWLNATIGSMSDGVWMCDQSGEIETVNDAGLQMFRLRREDVVGHPIGVLSRLFGVGRSERRRLGLRAALEGQPTHTECDVELPGAGHVIAANIRATPVRDERGAVIGAVAVVRDITHAKAMDRLKEDFLSIAAHELKTPITALKGYTQLALKRVRRLPLDRNVERWLETIDEQSDRITSLIHKLLDVGRIHAGRLELQFSRFDFQELVAGVAQHARLVATEHTIDAPPHEPVVITADAQRLEQVLYNLVDNAIKYSPAGGTIQIRTEITEAAVRVTVHDEGLGIPTDKLPHIFDRWYQAHFGTQGDYGGMGLGLYICKEIVERHGGHMWATSQAEGGTCVGFWIPRQPRESEPSVESAMEDKLKVR